MTVPSSSLTFSGAAKSGTLGSLRGIVRWIGHCADAFTAYLERRAAIRVLAERDDRELRDIGLTRSNIEAAVGGALNPQMGRLDYDCGHRTGDPRRDLKLLAVMPWPDGPTSH
jgi:uncharacterized protein YjiS (DUF1127 family)